MRPVTKYCLNFLIIFYLGVIYFAGVPDSNTLNFRLKDKAMKLALAVGIWPSWSMFAPNPIRFDSTTYVSLTYKNGDIKVYNVEKKLGGIFKVFRKARWMKYSQDNLRSHDQRALLKPAMSYFKKKFYQENNPIVSVKILRRWNEIPPFSNSNIASIYKTPRTSNYEVLISEMVEE